MSSNSLSSDAKACPRRSLQTITETYTDRGQLHTLAFGSTTIDTCSCDDGGRVTGSVYDNEMSETITSTIGYCGFMVPTWTTN